MISMVSMVFMVIITSTGVWVQVNKLAATCNLIVIGTFANNRASVSLSVIPMNTGVEDITKVWISPVTTWQESTVKWDSSNSVFNYDLSMGINDWCMNWEWFSMNVVLMMFLVMNWVKRNLLVVIIMLYMMFLMMSWYMMLFMMNWNMVLLVMNWYMLLHNDWWSLNMVINRLNVYDWHNWLLMKVHWMVLFMDKIRWQSEVVSLSGFDLLTVLHIWCGCCLGHLLVELCLCDDTVLYL